MHSPRPAFSQNNIPVIFCTDGRFLPYTAVALSSLAAAARDGYNYDLFIVSAEDIPSEAQNRLRTVLGAKENISLRFVLTGNMRGLLPSRPLVRENYRDISQGREEMEICYLPSYDSRGLACKLKETRSRDIAAGFCTAGPHREDFDIILSGKQAKLFASQGQQRSAVLSLKLAEAAAAQSITGQHPVMLLDDVLSELDDMRQSYLLSRMEQRQTIVTACDAGLFCKTDGKVLYVKQGTVSQTP